MLCFEFIIMGLLIVSLKLSCFMCWYVLNSLLVLLDGLVSLIIIDLGLSDVGKCEIIVFDENVIKDVFLLLILLSLSGWKCLEIYLVFFLLCFG